MHGKTARAWLTQAAGAKGLLSQVERLQRLQSSLARQVPAALTTAARVSSCDGGTVVIGAGSGAVAHRLKLLSTSLLEEFKKQDQEVTQIRIEVQGDPQPASARTPKRALLPVAALDPLERLVGELPDSALRTALARLATRAKR